jgi:hypothetical protein
MNSLALDSFKNPLDIILCIIVFFPLIRGFATSYSSKNLKNQIEDFWGNVAFIAAIILGSNVTKKIFINKEQGVYELIYSKIPQGGIAFLDKRPITIYIIIMPIIIFIFYVLIDFVIKLINSVTIYLILDGIQSFLKKRSQIVRRIAGAIFQIPTAASILIIAVVALNLGLYLNFSQNYTPYVENSIVYNYVNTTVVYPLAQSDLAKQIPNIINNSFKISTETSSDTANNSSDVSKDNKVIIYYNGITLEEGIRSNEEIDSFALELTKNEGNLLDKAESLYGWIGSSIEYDYNKADKILSNDFNVNSGTINTYYTRKGICFDYACLFASMCIANDIKVRLITGEGKSGGQWVSHAWNQIYDSSKDKWINVDPTFYIGGNYFDSPVFNLDHRKESVAGEW